MTDQGPEPDYRFKLYIKYIGLPGRTLMLYTSPAMLHWQLNSDLLDADEPLLDESIMKLLAWCWKYYKHAPGEVLAGALPPALRQAETQLAPPH